MKYLILLCIWTALGCGGLPRKADLGPRNPATDYSDPGYGKAQISSDQYLRFNDLKKLLINNNVTSIEDALPLLNSKYYDYLRFHTLMYGSFSIQHSSFEEPRALVFGPDARFIFSFNGNPNQMGGKSFETVEYSEKTHSFEFREITFKKYPGFEVGELDLKPDEIAFQNENILISKPNPAKCLQCHGQNASPIWQTYFMWPGAYGSNDDQLFMSFDSSSWNPNNEGFFKSTQKPSSQGRRIGIKRGFKDAELEGLVRYASGKSKHPRYKWLPPKFFEAAALRYAQGAPFADLDFAKQAKEEFDQVKATIDWNTRPNSFLLGALEYLNSDRLIARLEKEGLKNAFVSPAWEQLYFVNESLDSNNIISTMATKIEKVISEFNFRGRKPTLKEIQSLLTKNLKDEFAMQRERIHRQTYNLGKSAVQYQPYILVGENGAYSPEVPRPVREGMEMIQNAQEFYTQLLGLKQFTEFDKIAAGIETDNQFLMTAVAILLSDRGINLHDYTLNLKQTSLSFHSGSYPGGIVPALRFLGIVGQN